MHRPLWSDGRWARQIYVVAAFPTTPQHPAIQSGGVEVEASVDEVASPLPNACEGDPATVGQYEGATVQMPVLLTP